MEQPKMDIIYLSHNHYLRIIHMDPILIGGIHMNLYQLRAASKEYMVVVLVHHGLVDLLRYFIKI